MGLALRRRDGADRDPRTWIARPSRGSPSSRPSRPSRRARSSAVDTLLNQPPSGGDADRAGRSHSRSSRDRRGRPRTRPRGAETLGGVLLLDATAERPDRRRRSGHERRRRTPCAAQLVGLRRDRGRRSTTGPPASRRRPGRGAVPAAGVPARSDQRRRRTAGWPLDAQQAASRAFLGIVFVVLLFITVVIYGMWVATGVAAEKSSRVMELMISAASPRQMLTGKVVGIGAAGLTQYLAIAIPALVAARVPGPDRRGRARARTGPTARRSSACHPALLAGYGGLLPARVHAVRADLRLDGLVREPAGRPPDAVAAAQPGRDGRLPVGDRGARRGRRGVGHDRVVPAAVQPVRDAGAAHGRAPSRPGRSCCRSCCWWWPSRSSAVAATRMYAAGVLLYGTRPGVRAFVAAARRAQ